MRREDDNCVVDIDQHGQGFSHVKGHDIIRSYWACVVCGQPTGGPEMECLDHPRRIAGQPRYLGFLKHDRISPGEH